ncbi:MAG: cytochrome C [Methylococcaceae bacterium]|nr:cytochrome C [Methylococcaceae bacterium]
MTAAPLHAAGKPKLSLGKVRLQDGQLTIHGRLKNAPAGSSVDLLDVNGKILGTAPAPTFSVTLAAADLASIPCTIRAQWGALEAQKPVAGAPKNCGKTPSCKILEPRGEVQIALNQAVSFKGQAKLRDRQAKPLKLEWDFAGGVLGEEDSGVEPAVYRRSTGSKATVKFIRDNSRYRVRFAAIDGQRRYCEDSIEVVVGNPASDQADFPAKVTEQEPAGLGEQLDSAQGKLVVLPYEDWTFQNASDMKLIPGGYSGFNPVVNSLRAVVYAKDKKPPVVGDNAVNTGDAAVGLRYSAGSNPSDPAGRGSINSTSQNWPLAQNGKAGVTLKDALIQKTDRWETFDRTENLADGYVSVNWMQAAYYDYDWASALPVIPDEGIFHGCKHDATDPKDAENYAACEAKFMTPINPDHGRYMPGIAAPYSNNDPQPFSRYDAQAKRFEANMIPLTGVDDRGRVNPYPILRVEAVQKDANGSATETVKARADAVVSAGSDFHCRECHEKGKIAAKPNTQKQQEGLPPYTEDAFHSTAFASWWDQANPPDKKLSEPLFKTVAADFGGDPDSVFDQEYAASFNFSSLHDFYDEMYFTDYMLNGVTSDGKVTADSPHPCYGCHYTAQASVPFNRAGWDMPGWDINSYNYAPNYSVAIHRFHGQLQWNADKTDIQRESSGRYKRWDWSQGPNNKKSTSLFPIFEDDGKTQLPMEENCNRCHAGHREQFYRDRMYTAGVSCFDCHGDMLAVGQAYPKDLPNHPDRKTSQANDDYRQPWFDQPDCGSCHVGSGNVGQDAKNGFFSAGVRKRAFDDSDWSATPRAVDLKDPDASRFAVVPNYQLDFPVVFMVFGPTQSDPTQDYNLFYNANTPLFREGRDSHGNVPCAACHGAAHAIWPNRNPSANDNVTALQLQGHTGTILECGVCHTADSFKAKADLDGGIYMTDLPADSGVLGGPHNTHPINDPFWWKNAEGDTANSDGSTIGGWHNNYAVNPGKNEEDQCAACHGNDRKGTRLSKTPVDRTFDFSDLDWPTLRAAGFKSKVVKVAAGTPIGCNTCHDIKTSCKGSPFAGCGTATGYVNTSPNHAPVFAAPTAATTAVLGQPYEYNAKADASDSDGDALKFSLGTHPADMTVDPDSGIVKTQWPSSIYFTGIPPFTFTYAVTVNDGRGGWAKQPVNVTLNCPQASPHWDNELRQCSAMEVTSPGNIGGFDAGQAVSYRVTTNVTGKFSLKDAPKGMTIDPDTGVISWIAAAKASGSISFVVLVNGGEGKTASQNLSVTVCVTDHWNAQMGHCM